VRLTCLSPCMSQDLQVLSFYFRHRRQLRGGWRIVFPLAAGEQVNLGIEPHDSGTRAFWSPRSRWFYGELRDTNGVWFMELRAVKNPRRPRTFPSGITEIDMGVIVAPLLGRARTRSLQV
jgi:hypothetical protein